MATTRREVIGMGASAVLLAAAAPAHAATGTQVPARTAPAAAGAPTQPGAHTVQPLPFDARKLRGISEKLIVSHHDNNYAAAVKSLNKVEADITALPKDAAPYLVHGLKERELVFTNSRILHEHYFANLGGDGKAGGAVQAEIAKAYGSFATWETQFRATGMALGGGSGWVVLAWNLHDGRLGSYWSGNHSQALAFGVPLLVLDMYEHAYQMDYGAAAAKYVDAFFDNVQWAEVERRFERAKNAAAALKA